jgi:hypothetical protein
MSAVSQAEELRQQAIGILLAERGEIDDKLAALSYNSEPVKRRGRPPKEKAPDESGADATPSA